MYKRQVPGGSRADSQLRATVLCHGSGHVGKDEVFEVQMLDRPAGIEDGLVAPDDERALTVGVALFDELLVARQGVAVWRGPVSR